jgi:hypothetical protein
MAAKRSSPGAASAIHSLSKSCPRRAAGAYSLGYHEADGRHGSYARKTLAEKLGIGIETVRYYERLGIIPPPRREANGYRRYGDADVANIGASSPPRSGDPRRKGIEGLIESMARARES